MMLRYLTLTSYQMKFKCMLCYLKFTSWNKDDAALLNVNFISNKMSLVRKVGSCFFPKNKGSWKPQFQWPKMKKGWPSYKYQPVNLDFHNAPKRRFWTLAILNNFRIPQGRYWRPYLVYQRVWISDMLSLNHPPKLVDVGRSSWGIFSQGRGGFAFEGWWMQCLPRRLGTFGHWSWETAWPHNVTT